MHDASPPAPAGGGRPRVVAAIWFTTSALSPLPPGTVTMATGPSGGAYQDVGKRYQEIPRAPRHRAQPRPDRRRDREPGAPARPSLGRRRRPCSRAASPARRNRPISSRWARCSTSPLVLPSHHRRGKGLEVLRGRKISIGLSGSGTRALVLLLLARQRLDRNFAQLLGLNYQDAAEALVRGEIDAAFMLASWDSPAVRRLLTEDGVELMSFPAPTPTWRCSLPEQAHGARRRGRPREEPAPDRGDASRAQGQPGRAPGSPPRDPVPAPRRGRAGPLRGGHLPPAETVPGSGGGRPAAQRRGAPVLPLGPALSPASPALLARGGDRPGSRVPHP